MNTSEIHLFDFDATLFRSPEPPDWWSGSSWWADQRSLSSPCVPDVPGDDWWIGPTVAQARRSISDPNVYAVLATGRPDSKFRWRVPELLKMKGLSFDEVHLNPGADTFAFKSKLLARIYKRYPFVNRIRIWDDQAGHLSGFARIFGPHVEVEVNPVRVRPMEPVCEPESIDRVAQRYMEPPMNPSSARVALRHLEAAAIGPYEDSIIDGLKVTQVRVDNRRSGASIQGNRLLVKWGQDVSWWSESQKAKQLTAWIRWAKRKLGQKAERVEQKKEWRRTVVGGYSVYDIEGKDLVAGVLARVERDVTPILREFGLSFQTIKESVAEGSLGFNRDRRIIALNVRQTRDPMKLRKYSAVMRTMIHELAHLRHMNHGPQFEAFDTELLTFARVNGIYQPG